ncbi:MAG: SEC-C domain-containing protein [Alteromonadaceae bacterium]|nr:SEC-C domain-containing protein [Alteromonadaceae bacterium]
MLCPCGSTKLFTQCCQPILEGKHAKTAEQLMRSRYSAYATKNATYLYNTYANAVKQAQSVTDIEQWAKQCKWIKLTIHQASSSFKEKQQTLATVAFSALYLQKAKLFCLQELSTFINEDDQWRYLEGDIINHKLLNKVKANDLCPCNSNKKFKKCCGVRF